MYIFYNPNPVHQFVGDCVIRAVSKLTGETWDDVYTDITLQGLVMKDIPINVDVWRGCCETVSVRNISDQPIQVQNANVIFARPDLLMSR